MKKNYLLLFAILFASCCTVFAQTTFNYTGSVQFYTVPCGVTQINVDVRGAQGQINADALNDGGLGGRVQGTMTVVPCEILQVYVGGGGTQDTMGGFNGGGNAGVSDVQTQWLPSPACPISNGGGGGGASDIRTPPYTLVDRQVVGGGGGGTGGNRNVGCGPGAGGGGGGGYYGGGGGGGYSGLPGVGGSQIAGGAGGLSPGCAIFGGQAGTAGGFGFGGLGGDAPGNNQAGSAPGCVGGAGGTLVGATGVNCTTGGCPGTWSGGSGGGGSNWQGTLTAVTQTQGFQAGNGLVIITAVGGCIPLAISSVVVQPTCGNCNGSITITASGGSAPYTYLWTPAGQTTATITGLCAGNYGVTVTDACGSIQTANFVLTSTQLSVVANVKVNELCNGECVGVITSTVVGGVPPFTYAWTPTGGTNANASALCAGTYTLVVTDINGCSGTATATVTQPPLLTASIASTNIFCNGGTNGSATVTAAGGTPAYTYLWNPGGNTNATITGLSAGNYTVTVTDNNGCTATANVIIVDPPLLTATITAQTNVLCNGGNNGTATVIAGGGTPGYTYNWTPIGGNGTIGTGFSAGTYTVTVTDANGCTATASVTITQPPILTANITALTNVSCNPGNNGTATVTVGGGTPGYSYNWNPNGGSNSTGTGLSVGTYTVVVTDANGCTASAVATITQPTPITLTTSFTQATCNQSNGSATVVAVGGTPAYTYLWTPSGETNATATGLSASTYTVVVTDNNGCTATAIVTVTQPNAVNASITASTNILCNGGTNGSATVTAVGGTAPYTYLWNPSGQTNATATGLSAGSYTVTVTDNNGCVITATINITQPPPLTAVIGGSTNLLCNGANTGNATVIAGGGTPAYNYNWTPNGGTNFIGTGLTAGTYTVTVTDADGCTATASVTITQPTLLTATITAQTNVSCFGDNNGNATVTAGGGTPGYSYVWTPTGGTNAIASALTAGTYTITVTDNDGCTATATVTITQPNLLTATVTFTPASCNLSNGSATVTVIGGTGPYAYLWTPSNQTNATATGLSANTYTVVVTDINTCTTTATVTVTQPTAVTATITSSTNILCNGANTGSATVTVVGGSVPYTYLWNPGNTNATATGLSAGTYTITVTDNTGCISTATVTLSQPPLLTAIMGVPTNVSCNGGNNGSATVTAGGGTPGYTYNWTPIGGTGATGIGLTAGTYTVTVTDANGCTATATVTINQPPLFTATIIASTNVTCNGANNGSATVLGGGGTPNYSYSWAPNGGTNTVGTGLGAATYTITITDANSCTATATVTITQPAILATTLTPSNVSCFGGNNGNIASLTTCGTIAYRYTWSNGETTATDNNLTAGTYTLTVTDANGCTTTASTSLTSPSKLTVTASGPQADCSGATITLNSTASGGVAPYTYNWAPGGGTTAIATAAPVVTTVYTITVTDANGCKAQATVSVFVEPALALTLAGNTSVCPGGIINLIAKASGGDGNYIYTWLPSNLNASGISFSPSGNTTVTITVTDGCGSAPGTLIIPITVNPPPSVSFTSDVVTGCSPLCIQFRNLTTITSGGINQFTWNFGNNDTSHSQSPIYCYTDTGFASVSLTAISDSGCSSTLLVSDMIQVYPSPNANFTYSPQPINILNPSVQFSDLSTGKYRIAEWYWTFGDGTKTNSTLQNPEHQYSDTGTYCATLVVVDMHGCVDSITNCLVVNPLFTFYIPDAFTPNDDGINDVFMPKGKYIKDYEMYIFDRWGMKLFYTNDINTGWDGRVNKGSQVSQEDTYVYLINVTDTQGNKHSYTGKVSLLK